MIQTDIENYNFLSDSSPVTVFIPTYNRYSKLKRLIESLKKTKFPVKEIIVIDDFSDEPYYNSFEEEYPYIKYIRHSRVKYVGESRNEGIKIIILNICLYHPYG